MSRPARSYLRAALEESPGVDSSIRLQLFIVTCAVVTSFLGLSIGVAFGTIADIPPGLVTLGTLLFTSSAGAKVIQQRNE